MHRTTLKNARGGFTLLELAVSMTVLVIAIGAITSTLVATDSLGRTNRERSLALDGAQSAFEAVRGADFDEVFAAYNADPDDDPGLPGSAPGMLFAVPGLDVRAGDPDGFVGTITFPGDGIELREDVVDDNLGLPRDLNSDGVIDGLDHAADYTILPYRVRVEWTGKAGNQFVEFVGAITRR